MADDPVTDTLAVGHDPQTTELGPGALRPTLLALTGQLAGRTFTVDGPMLVGRAPDCTIQVDSAAVSRHHARIAQDHGDWLLTDLGSRNGTYVNGARTDAHRLRFGDRVSVSSDALFLFTHQDPMEEQLLHQQRMEAIGRLAGGVAHDFNNVLGAVLANVSVLLDMPRTTPVGNGDVREILSDLRSAALQAVELTQQLLGFARRGKYEVQAIPLSELVEEVLRITRRTFDPRISIQTSFQPGLAVLGDRTQLNQLVMNLLLNARDAMPEGGLLSVRTMEASRSGLPARGGAESAWLMLEVVDSGIGMTQETRARIFEPFFTTKQLGRGSGLGLATVYGIAKGHGGDISVESEPGRGSCFRVLLPRTDRLPRDFVSTPPVTRDVIPVGGVAMVVDDDELHARSTERLLRQAGYEVVLASDGADGVRQLRMLGPRVGVVLLDVTMPVMGGEEACRHIRGLHPTARIIAMSGYTDSEKANALLAAGADAFLRKPFDRESLLSVLARVLGG